MMNRVGCSLMSLMLAMSLWAAPVPAQDKFVVGFGGGT